MTRGLIPINFNILKMYPIDKTAQVELPNIIPNKEFKHANKVKFYGLVASLILTILATHFAIYFYAQRQEDKHTHVN